MYATGKQDFSSKRISGFPVLTYWKLSFINVSSRRGEDKFFTQRKFGRRFLMHSSTNYMEKILKFISYLTVNIQKSPLQRPLY